MAMKGLQAKNMDLLLKSTMDLWISNLQNTELDPSEQVILNIGYVEGREVHIYIPL